MPFRFHLKKSRQYNVVSKNQYVICIELLDASTIECTLNIDSLGQECLDSVSQRLNLGQPQLFGLRYICRRGGSKLANQQSSNNTPRWLDVNKPLKKQLDKYAKSFHLYLRIIYYVNDVHFIHDDMTRYHYYLQLKSDFLEGKIDCNVTQATLLASYSLQAEFGDYDRERHMPECFQQCTLFPKAIVESESNTRESLLNSTLCQYQNLTGVTQPAAEEIFISIMMQSEGYGYETFSAKDESSNDTLLGVSVKGIMVGYPNTQATQFYRWKDISNVINHKKTFRIECQAGKDDAKQFTFGESRDAKYVWRLCIAQHTFHMHHQDSRPPSERITNSFCDTEMSDSNERAPLVNLSSNCNGGDEEKRWTSYNDLSTCPYPVVSVSSTDINNLRAFLPSYRPAPDYETAVQIKYNNNGNNSQPYYSNQSVNANASVGQSDLSCILGNVVNRNRF